MRAGPRLQTTASEIQTTTTCWRKSLSAVSQSNLKDAATHRGQADRPGIQHVCGSASKLPASTCVRHANSSSEPGFYQQARLVSEVGRSTPEPQVLAP